jgi:hypothetical protein
MISTQVLKEFKLFKGFSDSEFKKSLSKLRTSSFYFLAFRSID